MDAVKFFKEKERLCKSHDDVNCNKCELHNICDVAEKAEEVVAIVEKWSAEHPQKTYLTDFLEKHPDAPLSSDGEPDACARCCGYRKDCPGQSCRGCLKCWNTPMEETK